MSLQKIALVFLLWLPACEPVFATGQTTGTPKQVFRAGSTASFSPIDLLSIVAWMTTPNAGNISSWTNQVPGGPAFVQADSAKQPTYQATGINGAPSLKFDGSNDTMTMTMPQTYTAFSCFVVVRSLVAGSYRTLFGNAGAPAETITFYASTSQTTMWWSGHGNIPSVSTPVNSFPINTTLFVGYTYDGTNVRVYINGALIKTSVTLSGVILTPNAIIGHDSVGGYDPLNGHLSDIFVYGRILPDAEVTLLYNYLKPLRGLP